MSTRATPWPLTLYHAFYLRPVTTLEDDGAGTLRCRCTLTATRVQGSDTQTFTRSVLVTRTRRRHGRWWRRRAVTPAGLEGLAVATTRAYVARLVDLLEQGCADFVPTAERSVGDVRAALQLADAELCAQEGYSRTPTADLPDPRP
jgi:hypothetical protein